MEAAVRRNILAVAVTLVVLAVRAATAGQAEFCAGFDEGYRSIKGNGVIVPVCPIAPITPVGSMDFQQGILAGIRAANG
jgi:hypothetical protein